MKFALRKPCRDCPFRCDRNVPFFGRDDRGFARAQQLKESFTQMHLFPCHKTTVFDEEGQRQVAGRTSACAGMVIMAERSPEGSNVLRIAARLGLHDPASMDDSAPVYADYDAFVNDHDPNQGD